VSTMNKAVIGIGSNINAPENIRRAIKLVGDAHEILAESKLHWTKPIGFPDQPDFLNGAILIQTKQNRDSLKTYLQSIEIQLGRVRTLCRYGPRTIDLDIVVWNGKIIDRDFYEREFLKFAVLEVFPALHFH